MRASLLEALNDLQRFALGFDRAFKTLEVANNVAHNGYPPYNVRKVNGNHYMVEIAVAGFKKDEIEITVESGKLTVKGNKKVEHHLQYLYKGIADRTFIRDYYLADTIRVLNASIMDGVLYILLENKIPEELKPKKIYISDDPVSVNTTKELLVEADQYPSKKLAEETAEKL